MTNFNPNFDAIKGDASITSPSEYARRLMIEHLRQYAEFKGITHEDLARAAGMKRSSVSRLLSGRFDPRLRTFLKIAGALNLHLELAERTGCDK